MSHKLPSEQQRNILKAQRIFNEKGKLLIQEPCDCGRQIRHNNGGNYHEVISLRRDNGEVYVKFDTTCELTPLAEWEPCPDWEEIISRYSDWLIS